MTTPNRKVIYSALQEDFFKDVLLNQVASKMRENQNSFSNQKTLSNLNCLKGFDINVCRYLFVKILS